MVIRETGGATSELHILWHCEWVGERKSYDLITLYWRPSDSHTQTYTGVSHKHTRGTKITLEQEHTRPWEAQKLGPSPGSKEPQNVWNLKHILPDWKWTLRSCLCIRPMLDPWTRQQSCWPQKMLKSGPAAVASNPTHHTDGANFVKMGDFSIATTSD